MRTDNKGFPYSNDHIKIEAIAGVIAEQLIAAVSPGDTGETRLYSAIEAHDEYDGLKFAEFWLSVIKAASLLHDHAFEKFTHLITDRAEETD